MKTRLKQTLMAGAVVTTVGLGVAGAGIASAATSGTNGQDSLIQKIATKFNLKTADVAAVFSADRQERQANHQAELAKRLSQAVTDGKLTQAQADYITNAQKEIQALRDQAEPGQETTAQRQAVRAKVDALRDWAKANNVDLKYIGQGFGHRFPGGPDGDNDGDDRPADQSSSSSSSSN